MEKNTVLVVASHPDDEVLGCGGTMARLASEGSDVYVLLLGEGVTSRDEKRDVKGRRSDLDILKDSALRANAILGVKEVFFADFPDNRFDAVPLLDLIKKIEEVITIVNPHTVFTHYARDLNIDHRQAALAVKTATRPLPGASIKEVFSFSVLSSTEWNYGESPFSPNIFFDISSYVDKKRNAMICYEEELRPWPHPRSLEAMEAEWKLRGAHVGVSAAEAFILFRKIF